MNVKGYAHIADSLRLALKYAKTDTERVKIYYELSRNFDYKMSDSCIYYAQQTLTLAQKTNNKMAKGFAYMMLGNANFSRSDYAVTLQYYIQAANIFALLQPQPKELGKVYGKIASVYGELDDYALGRVYADKCIQFCEKYGTAQELASAYNNVANFYENLKMYDKTIFYEQKAIEITDKNNLPFAKAIAHFNMGSALRQLGRHTEAKPYLQTSLQTSREIEDIEGLIYCYIEFAHFYLEKEKRPLSLVYVDSALAQLKDYHSWDLSKEAYWVKSQIFAQNQQYDSAYSCFQKSTIFKDSIFKDTRQNMVYNYNTNQKIYQLQQESQQKEQQLNRKITVLFVVGLGLLAIIITLFLLSWQKTRHNKLLSAKNIEIEAQKEALKVLNHDKDKLISIISHDLRSPLNQLKALLDLLNVNIISQQDFSAITQKLNHQVDTISENLENLLQWVQSQIRGKNLNPEWFEVATTVNSVLALYETPLLQKQINVSIQIAQGLRVYMDKENLKVALRNLISNAIKFSHPHSTLAIVAGEKNQEVFIGITDEGQGMTEFQLTNLFNATKNVSSLGTLRETGTGLGLKLSKEFIEKAGGRMEVKSELGKGSTFTIFAPQGKNEAFVQEN